MRQWTRPAAVPVINKRQRRVPIAYAIIIVIVISLLIATINLYMNLSASLPQPMYPPAILLDIDPAVCPGLCPSTNTSSQLVHIRTLIDDQMRHIAANSFVSNGVGNSPKIDQKYVHRSIDYYSSIWSRISKWVNERSMTPANLSVDDFSTTIVAAVSTANIIDSTVAPRGTQLKLLVTFEGGQRALLKPARYDREYTIDASTPYAGADRHNGEIAAFHVAHLLDLRRTPIVVGRRVEMRRELMHTSSRVLNATFFTDKTGRLCVYGKCLYCRREEAACANNSTSDVIETAIVLWLPTPYNSLKAIRSPWARTYDDSKSAEWESSHDYCKKVINDKFFGHPPVLLDLIDMSIFDFLIGNADRHRLEYFASSTTPMILLLDNGKSFGNAQSDELSILAPLYQCCMIRQQLYRILLRYTEVDFAAFLDDRLRSDPLYPILTVGHLEALNRRVRIVTMVIDTCIATHGVDYVLRDR